MIQAPFVVTAYRTRTFSSVVINCFSARDVDNAIAEMGSSGFDLVRVTDGYGAYLAAKALDL